MNPFLTNFLAGLATNLTVNVVSALSGKLKKQISGTPKEQVVERCLQSGITAFISIFPEMNETMQQHVEDVFEKLFQNEAVADEIALLLHGDPINKNDLVLAFKKNGFDQSTLPQIDLTAALHAFENAFLVAALEEDELRDIVQAEATLKSLKVQKDSQNLLKQLVMLQRENNNLLKMQNGQIQLNSGEILSILPPTKFGEIGADWEKYYLNLMIKQCNVLDLTPIDETHSVHLDKNNDNDVKLSDVFINLNLHGLVRLSRQTISEAILKKQGHRPAININKEIYGKEYPISAIEAIYSMNRLVILGRPGGGKSTLANHIITQLASRRLGQTSPNEKLPGWNENDTKLPVLIILRRFAAWLDSTKRTDNGAGCVWDYLEYQMEKDGCKEAFTQIKAHGVTNGAVVFFDGLDEIQESDESPLRTRIVKTIGEFAKNNDHCQIIITCREYSYKVTDDWRLPEQLFPVVELALFNDEQVEHFTNVWYKTVGPSKGWDKTKCETEARNLFFAIKEYPHLHELSQYPLLLTLMAQVHGRDGYLPKDRADLYERAVNLLLAHWENRIIRDVSGSLKVEPSLIMELGVKSDILRSALESVAFFAHEQQEKAENRGERTADIAKEDLREELNRELKDLNKVEKVMTYIQERAGLLQARDNRTYTFPHRTFQEYLTACFIMKQQDFDTMLCERISRDLPWWSEVFLLAAGTSRKFPRNIMNLVDAILPALLTKNDIDSTTNNKIQLAAQALIETDFSKNITTKYTDKYKDTLENGRKCLRAAIEATQTLQPTERAQSGTVLARLGDPRKHVLDVDAMHFCLVPGGPFVMGSDKKEDKLAYDWESPKHTNNILKDDFWMAQFPVTVAQFKQFVDATKHDMGDEPWHKDAANQPVRYINWHDAMAFCHWLAARWEENVWLPAGFQIILPSEAEWEKAARGGLQRPATPVISPISELKNAQTHIELNDNEWPARLHPWGQEMDKNKLNFSETGIGTPSPVGCFPNGVSLCGCEEMSGNVWEWTRSLDYTKFPYPYDPKTGCENLEAKNNDGRVLRGGAFYYYHQLVRCANRVNFNPNRRRHYYGFRVVLRPFSER